MNFVRRLFLTFVLLALAAAGCARTHAKTEPERPGLEMPTPPPHVVPPPEPEKPAQTPPPEPETPQPRPTRPRASAPRSTEPKVEAPKPEKKPEPPPPTEVKPLPPAPTPTLQPALPTAPTEMERQVREQLSQAARDLARVDYGGLNADGKSQYDTAKRFIEQADQALRDKNLVFAQKLAEKAAGLAAVLLGR